MPIVVRHTPVGALGQLAVAAGQARGQQLQAGRDLQLTSMAMAAEDRAAAIGMAASDRAFALQRAASSQMARQRPAEPDMLEQRRKLHKTIAEAEKAGIYNPAQIKQMEIFANMGDPQGVRRVLGDLPSIPVGKPSAKQVELTRQSRVLNEATQRVLSPLQKQLGKIALQLESKYAPEVLEWLRENPKFVNPELRTLFSQEQQIEDQISGIRQEVGQRQQQLEFGISLPAQETRRLQKIFKDRQAKIEAANRVEGRNQKRIERQLTAETRKLKVDPYADPKTESTRVAKAQKTVDALEKELKASFDRQDAALGVTPGLRRLTPSEESAVMDALLMETGGDIEAAKRLWTERSNK